MKTSDTVPCGTASHALKYSEQEAALFKLPPAIKPGTRRLIVDRNTLLGRFLQYSPNLRWKNKGATIVTFVKVCDDRRRLWCLIFMDKVTRVRKHLELVFACPWSDSTLQ